MSSILNHVLDANHFGCLLKMCLAFTSTFWKLVILASKFILRVKYKKKTYIFKYHFELQLCKNQENESQS